MREYADVPPEAGGPGGKAGPGTRLLAKIVDNLILLLPTILLGVVIGGGFDLTGSGELSTRQVLAGIVTSLVSYGYFVVLESSRGTTPGKRLAKVEVRGREGGLPTTEEAARRNLWMLLTLVPAVGPLLGLGAAIAIGISISSDPEARGYHDRWAGTTPVMTS